MIVTLADQYRANALYEVGEDYLWGAEGDGAPPGDDDYDCSGFFWAMLKDVGIELPRLTAHGYYKRGKRILNPRKVGVDFAVMLDSEGHATHIIPYIGENDTVEARGRAYGIVRSTVKAVGDRGGVWMRLPDIDLGELTGARPAVCPRKYPGHVIGWRHEHHDEVRWIQRRLNDHHVTVDGERIAVDGDFRSQTAAGVKKFRRRLGWARIAGLVGPKTWWELAR